MTIRTRVRIYNSIIRGREQEMSKQRIPRLAMTLPVMKVLKTLITRTSWTLEGKRLLWAVCTMAFHGSFRIHELLSRETTSFDPSTTLLGKDVKLVKTKIDGIEEILLVYLKSPKEDKLSQGVRVELFATGTFSCPGKVGNHWSRDLLIQ